MTDQSHAVFHILGPKENPTAEDYELEAALLGAEGHGLYRKHMIVYSGRMYELARRYRRIGRMKRWGERWSNTMN